MIEPHLKFETKFWREGSTLVCGVDEVGRGSLAGPLYVGAVVFKKNCKRIKGVRDSKLLLPAMRERLSIAIREKSLACSTGSVTHEEIDSLGLTEATRLATKRAIENLGFKPDVLLIDAFKYSEIKSQSIIKGDMQCYSIAAASIIAKVERDAYISDHPEAIKYGFAQNKGYCTKYHLEKLREYGPSPIHRRSFFPVSEYS